MTTALSWTSSVSHIPFVGPTYAKRLEKLDVFTVGDLLMHIPFRYEKFQLKTIAHLKPGVKSCVIGQVQSFSNIFTKKGSRIQKMVLSDATGKLNIMWFNSPFLVKTLKPGIKLSVAGTIDSQSNNLHMLSPDYEIINDNAEQIHTRSIVPMYHETAGVSSKWLRSKIAWLLKSSIVQEWLPNTLFTSFHLISLAKALQQIHFPTLDTEIEPARKRLAFDELFMLTLRSQYRRLIWRQTYTATPIPTTEVQIASFQKHLPFTLTGAQRRAIAEIVADFKQEVPMNRMLVGDVGSGKTVVAAFALFAAHMNNCKSAIMVPTEILAQQHFKALQRFLSPFQIRVGLRTQNQKTDETNWDVLVGTQALIQKSAILNKTKLIIIDEQHRFGVAQRALLRQKGMAPHVLTMTATPIPRTSALVAHGELDISYLDQMPQGGRSVKTWLVPPHKRAAAYSWIEEKIKTEKTQAFVVCPFVEPSETMETVKAATTEFEKLQKEAFSRLRLALIHGKLPAAQKESVLMKFRQHKIDVLVATPVIEVGIDIPNASIMLIEASERFGLAQLHQLRGRIGRLGQQAYCLLFSESESAQQRLAYVSQISDGSKLAEVDFSLRGPGDIYGTLQHGRRLFKVATHSDTSLLPAILEIAEVMVRESSTWPSTLKDRLNWDTIGTSIPD